jgi:hypothetical protein
MLYVAAVLFVVAVSVMGLDVAGVRIAHGAGVIGNVLLLFTLALLVTKTIRVLRHHE